MRSASELKCLQLMSPSPPPIRMGLTARRPPAVPLLELPQVQSSPVQPIATQSSPVQSGPVRSSPVK